MSIVASVRSGPILDGRDRRPPALTGMFFGLVLALPMWAVIMAFAL